MDVKEENEFILERVNEKDRELRAEFGNRSDLIIHKLEKEFKESPASMDNLFKHPYAKISAEAKAKRKECLITAFYGR